MKEIVADAAKVLEYKNKEKKMKAIVWSKNSCPYCVQAKALLTQKGIEFEERNIEVDWTKEQLLEVVPTARTLPQIFLNEEHVGGFTELRTKLNGQ
jgi:glutaredoxin 3